VHLPYRLRAGRLSGLAAALAAVGLVCGSGLPALAAPAATSAASTPPAATAAGAGRQLLLVNGDRLKVGSTEGKQTIVARLATRQDALTSLKFGGQVMEIPTDALPYLGQGLSLGLFEVSALEKAESSGRLPVRLTFTGRRPAIPGLKVTRSSAGAASGYLTAASAKKFGAALQRQFRADHSRGRVDSNGLFGHNVSISLAGSPATAGPTPAFQQHTLTVDARALNGKPDTNDVVLVGSADRVSRFNVAEGNVNTFFHGSTKFSVPSGHYFALAVFFNFTKTSAALRMVVVPQFTVAGKTTTVHVAAKSASSEITASTPLKTVNQLTTFELVRGEAHGGPFAISQSVSGISAWVNLTTRKPTVGTLRSFSSLTLTSPAHVSPTYAYNLDFPGPAGTIPAQHFVVTDATVATVAERYYQDRRAAGGWTAFGGTLTQLDGGSISLILPVTMPTTQTQFFSAGPSIFWSNETFNSENTFAGGDDDALRVYAPGEHETQDWNRYPLHPAPNVLLPGTTRVTLQEPSAFRQGNTLFLGTTPFTDNTFGHFGAGFFGDGNARVTGRYLIDQNGKKIAAGNAVNGIPGIKLSAKPSTVKFVLNAARSSAFFRLSPSSQTTWTWKSARDTSAQVPAGWFCTFGFKKNQLVIIRKCAVQSMMTLNYQVQGMSLGGLTQPGAQVLDLTAGHIQLVAPAAITGATAQVSYNDGDSWQPATVTAGAGGSFQIGYNAPAGVDVSLRVSATDSAGSSITETILRAYGVSQ
jgi:hypothetical protein